MSASLQFDIMSLPIEYAAAVVTILGIAITPVFCVWASQRYYRRPSRFFLMLCICVLLSFILEIIRLVPPNIAPATTKLFDIISTFLLLAVVADFVQGFVAITYLSNTIIKVYARDSHHVETTDAVKRGILRTRIYLSILIAVILSLDLIAIVMGLFSAPAHTTLSIRLRTLTAGHQIGFAVAPFHTIGATVLLEHMRDFKNVAEKYHAHALEKITNRSEESNKHSGAFLLTPPVTNTGISAPPCTIASNQTHSTSSVE
ncbi:hypothetical protein BASA50_007090 [Batrachochytrium salamandrivorans]|uniref:G-protein coupled receptors family 1 profile domain-containing protein n=1 Tax=Batrachochytrium salamandrivorans TaxID=1357716 RepID=A0ABQ8F8L5_9FUNG|nr:hypothetical protein BASA60_000576 [Batrachochytrium salamandrivorans]KAH6593864.1 hypothetical protein BASA50_007090 [Batrachochytrium salamandrivorans]KAH6600983.1 hypothetical protein BASA61_002110 [Batrachochytrium salamandrivorans]